MENEIEFGLSNCERDSTTNVVFDFFFFFLLNSRVDIEKKVEQHSIAFIKLNKVSKVSKESDISNLLFFKKKNKWIMFILPVFELNLNNELLNDKYLFDMATKER